MSHKQFENTSLGDSENMTYSQGKHVGDPVKEDTSNTLHCHKLQHADYDKMTGHNVGGGLMEHHPNQHHPEHPSHKTRHGMHSGKSHHHTEHKAADRIHLKKK